VLTLDTFLHYVHEMNRDVVDCVGLSSLFILRTAEETNEILYGHYTIIEATPDSNFLYWRVSNTSMADA
jgi:hypothetical protein